jgi:hypothetical protein
MARRTGQLVCQHLEGIPRKSLAKFPGVIRDMVKGRHGIYALYRKDRLHYIGLATNLRQRLKQHLRNQHAQTWDRFSLYLTIGDRHLREIESLFLRISKPRGNTVTPKLVRSENLRPELRKQIKEWQRRELDDIAPPVRRAKKKLRTKKKDKREPKGKELVLAPYAEKRFAIRFRYKGQVHKATVRKGGTIFYKGNTYASPSGAAKAVTGRARRGWTAWHYQRAPGDWVPLDELRR